MNIEFQKAIEKKRILPFAQGKQQVKKELKEAERDLAEALNRFQSRKYKYATITGYYSMFHSARALIYSKGYREKSHYYLLVALSSLFPDTSLLPKELISQFHDAMILREDADYHGNFTKEGADEVLNTAQDFLAAAKSIIKPK
ncbi:MAG: HEPN domain-containing protein [Candidatus Omnitrophica bacterium]|nr:HEPN domain-containing protein [Candidatus Omnitrophota bacterium]